jgi:hypothetical protein
VAAVAWIAGAVDDPTHAVLTSPAADARAKVMSCVEPQIAIVVAFVFGTTTSGRALGKCGEVTP